MALSATIHKIALGVADIDRAHYGDYPLTVARHPSETEERMMVRVLAFALHASETLAFGRGLSTDDEPDLWDRDLTGLIERWIDVGLPDERRLRKASGRARAVVVLAFGGNRADVWWRENATALAAIDNLTVLRLDDESARSLAGLCRRTLKLDLSVQEGQIWASSDEGSASLTLETLQTARRG